KIEPSGGWARVERVGVARGEKLVVAPLALGSPAGLHPSDTPLIAPSRQTLLIPVLSCGNELGNRGKRPDHQGSGRQRRTGSGARALTRAPRCQQDAPR